MLLYWLVETILSNLYEMLGRRGSPCLCGSGDHLVGNCLPERLRESAFPDPDQWLSHKQNCRESNSRACFKTAKCLTFVQCGYFPNHPPLNYFKKQSSQHPDVLCNEAAVCSPPSLCSLPRFLAGRAKVLGLEVEAFKCWPPPGQNFLCDVGKTNSPFPGFDVPFPQEEVELEEVISDNRQPQKAEWELWSRRGPGPVSGSLFWVTL